MVLRSKNSLLSRSGIGFLIMCSAGLALNQKAIGQSSQIPLRDLSSFKDPGSSWQIVGDVNANLEKQNVLRTSKGDGILVNLPGKKDHGQDLFTGFEHGDMDLELDYMMAAGSNSGIYLQGRYELQLLDSWGVTTPRPGDNGGIYERWDDSRGKGNEGYEGYAPRQNASKAPGLWQHLKVSFQAPRFDASGKKTQNAKILRVELNGVMIHENIELNGPTRGAIGGGDEKASGPLRIQGDHGAVAFKNIQFRQYDTPLPELTGLQYTAYTGSNENDMKELAKGNAPALTSSSPVPASKYALVYKGTLRVKEAGEYSFNLNTSGGGGRLKINNKESRGNRIRETLSAGDVPVEISYARENDWGSPSLGLTVNGPGFREAYFGDAITPDETDPIMLDASSNTILRSFIDGPGMVKIVHAVSVGSPEKVHYTYDMDRGSIVQAWRGDFLETTPMWHERGNGTSRPQGAVQRFGIPYFTLGRLAGQQDAWIADTTGSGYRPKGYVLDEQDRPTFRYQIFGSMVTDQIRVLADGHGIQRELTVTAPAADLYAKLADGAQIEMMDKDIYVIDGRSYYLQLQDAGGAKPVVRDSNGRKELIIPVRGRLSYSILF
jgi:hypothetical protein